MWLYKDKEISSIDEETKNRYKSRINKKEWITFFISLCI